MSSTVLRRGRRGRAPVWPSLPLHLHYSLADAAGQLSVLSRRCPVAGHAKKSKSRGGFGASYGWRCRGAAKRTIKTATREKKADAGSETVCLVSVPQQQMRRDYKNVTTHGTHSHRRKQKERERREKKRGFSFLVLVFRSFFFLLTWGCTLLSAFIFSLFLFDFLSIKQKQ